jgi:hypothetical protein
MRMPIQATAVARSTSVSRMSGAINASGCSPFKKAGCLVAMAACGAVCVGSLGSACVQCLAGLGASGCIDCF